MSGPLSKYHHSTSSLSLLSTNVGHYIGDGDTSIASVGHLRVVTGANDELADTGIDQNETNQLTHHFGIKYTSMEQFT